MAIKPSSGTGAPGSIPISNADSAVKQASNTVPGPQVVNPEAVAKAVKEYHQLKNKLKKPFLSGAASLFTDNIVFPTDMLDTANPANDPKYLHLLCAVIGLKQLEYVFLTPEQLAENDEEEGGGGEGNQGGSNNSSDEANP